MGTVVASTPPKQRYFRSNERLRRKALYFFLIFHFLLFFVSFIRNRSGYSPLAILHNYTSCFVPAYTHTHTHTRSPKPVQKKNVRLEKICPFRLTHDTGEYFHRFRMHSIVTSASAHTAGIRTVFQMAFVSIEKFVGIVGIRWCVCECDARLVAAAAFSAILVLSRRLSSSEASFQKNVKCVLIRYILCDFFQIIYLI